MQVSGVEPSNLFRHVGHVRIEFAVLCSQMRSQHSKQKINRLGG
jgi:hypothetical protein